MIGKHFKGELSALSLPDILEFLRVSRKTGVLSFKKDRIKKSLYVKDGNVIFATSSVPEERLGDMLFAKGKITKAQYDESVRMLGPGRRQGKILVEIGAITPKQLWESVQEQIRMIVYSLFNWDDGIFFFSAGELPSIEHITADVGISDLIVEGIRRIHDTRALMERFPAREVVLSRIDYGIKERVRLEPFERHVLELVDGKRSADEICRESEIGDSATIKVLYMLISIGYIKVKGKKSEASNGKSQTISDSEASEIIARYNKMFSYLYRYMMREVGPIAEHVL